MFEGINTINFAERFTTDEKCHEYLATIKWDIDYRCAKCSHPKYFAGKQPRGLYCIKCHYDESATAHTLSHKLKFPLRKVFYIVFIVVTGKKGISTHELSRKLSSAENLLAV
jgi:hypothetical protein